MLPVALLLSCLAAGPPGEGIGKPAATPATASPAVEAALVDLSSSDEGRRDAAVAVLSKQPAAVVHVAAVAASKSEDQKVRQAALTVLDQVRDAKASSDIARVLRKDPDANIRRIACNALANSAAPEFAIAELTNAARDDWEVVVRRAALLALGRLENPDAVDALVTLLEENEEAHDEYLTGIAAQALSIATGRSTDRNLEAWQHVAVDFRTEKEAEQARNESGEDSDHASNAGDAKSEDHLPDEAGSDETGSDAP